MNLIPLYMLFENMNQNGPVNAVVDWIKDGMGKLEKKTKLQEADVPFYSKENEDGSFKIQAAAANLPAMQVY